MSRIQQIPRHAFSIFRLILELSFALSLMNFAAAQEKPAGKAAPLPARTFVGSVVCQDCHGGELEDVKTGAHDGLMRADKERPNQGWGCEGCHGPASAHLANYHKIKNDPAEDRKLFNLSTVTAQCSRSGCHIGKSSPVDFGRSLHSFNNVGCMECHLPAPKIRAAGFPPDAAAPFSPEELKAIKQLEGQKDKYRDRAKYQAKSQEGRIIARAKAREGQILPQVESLIATQAEGQVKELLAKLAPSPNQPAPSAIQSQDIQEIVNQAAGLTHAKIKTAIETTLRPEVTAAIRTRLGPIIHEAIGLTKGTDFDQALNKATDSLKDESADNRLAFREAAYALRKSRDVGQAMHKMGADCSADNPNNCGAPSTALCMACHIEKRADFSMPFRHRINNRIEDVTSNLANSRLTWAGLFQDAGEQHLLNRNCSVLSDELGVAVSKAFNNELGDRVNRKLNETLHESLALAFKQALSSRLKTSNEQLQTLATQLENDARRIQAKIDIQFDIKIPVEVENRDSADRKTRYAEGLVSCVDCHSEHSGSLTGRRGTEQRDETCIRCHPDKGGPFVFEHLPTRVRGCVNCHTPHGSANSKLLARSDVRTLCLECHTNTPRTHNQSQARYQNCTICHKAVHGSNHDKTLFQ